MVNTAECMSYVWERVAKLNRSARVQRTKVIFGKFLENIRTANRGLMSFNKIVRSHL